MGEVQGEMYDSSDPALVKLGNNGFEGTAPPVLSTKVDQIRLGIFTGYLIWDSEAHFGPGNDAEVKVGKSIFHTNSPEEAAMGLEQELGIKVGTRGNIPTGSPPPRYLYPPPSLSPLPPYDRCCRTWSS